MSDSILYEDENVIVKPSSIEGYGVFAKRVFKKGEVVLSWHPKILTETELGLISEDQKRYINTLKDGSIVLMNIPERYVNSSDNPNTESVENADVALQDITIGEEITSSYKF